MARGMCVFLICDSGTTVFWFLKALGETIGEYCSSHDKEPVPLHRLTVVSNNIPGSEAFMMYASQHSVPVPGGRALISDLVECRLLAGSLLPEYVAVTGEDTNGDLDAFYKRAKKATGPRPEFIGVTTGNWITIAESEKEKVPTPCLLARGKGHGKFKHQLLGRQN